MDPAAPALSQHLLTRADLAKLEVPAGEILRWLADGWIEQAGTLPSREREGNPVFAVSERALQRDLATRLERIGKVEVVFTNLRVRSVLGRAMLARRGEEPKHVDFATEVDACIEVAREEARLDAHDLGATTADEDDNAEGAEESTVEHDEVDETHEDEEEGFFSFDELSSALDIWDDEDDDESAESPPQRPIAANLSGDSAADPLPEAVSAAEPVVEADVPEQPGVEESSDPEQAPEPEEIMSEASDDPLSDDIAADTVPKPGAVATGVAADDATAAAMAFEAALADGDEPEPAPEAKAPVDETTEDIVEPEVAAALAANDPFSFDEPAAAGEPSDDSGSVAEVLEPEPEPEAIFEPAPPAPAATESIPETTSAAAMVRVESFLGELRGALVELAQRPNPAAQAMDMQPLVAAVGEFGQRVEHGVAIGVHAAMNHQPRAAAAAPAANFVESRGGNRNLVLLAITFLLLCWAGIFWFKTGNAQLAMATAIGANVIGCCLLAGRR